MHRKGKTAPRMRRFASLASLSKSATGPGAEWGEARVLTRTLAVERRGAERRRGKARRPDGRGGPDRRGGPTGEGARQARGQRASVQARDARATTSL